MVGVRDASPALTSLCSAPQRPPQTSVVMATVSPGLGLGGPSPDDGGAVP